MIFMKFRGPKALSDIYEGGGGVKGKMMELCFEWRSEQSPLPETGGMRVQPQFSLDAFAP
jgi:hypothetical protein